MSTTFNIYPPAFKLVAPGQKGVNVTKTSENLNWSGVYMSVQSVGPFKTSVKPIPSILIAVINSGFSQCRISMQGVIHKLNGAAGSIIVIPDDSEIEIDLRTTVNTTHFYITREKFDEIASKFDVGNPGEIVLVPRLLVFDPVLEQLCLTVRSVLDDEPTGSALYVEQITRALVVHLLRRHSTISENASLSSSNERLGKRLLAQSREYIDARLGDRFSAADVAAYVGMSADHFTRIFKQCTGMTPHQFVIRCRVDRATRLLSETNKPIVQISYECGFADQVHLTRVFGRIVGTTPAAFRKQKKGQFLPTPE